MNRVYDCFNFFYELDILELRLNILHEYINAGCKFADINVAKFFSKETEISENKDIETFAFHNYSGSNIKYPKF